MCRYGHRDQRHSLFLWLVWLPPGHSLTYRLSLPPLSHCRSVTECHSQRSTGTVRDLVVIVIVQSPLLSCTKQITMCSPYWSGSEKLCTPTLETMYPRPSKLCTRTLETMCLYHRNYVLSCSGNYALCTPSLKPYALYPRNHALSPEIWQESEITHQRAK